MFATDLNRTAWKRQVDAETLKIDTQVLMEQACQLLEVGRDQCLEGLIARQSYSQAEVSQHNALLDALMSGAAALLREAHAMMAEAADGPASK